MISAERLARRLKELDGIGTSPTGVNRLAWTEEDARCRAWFERQAEELGRPTTRDPAGNLWACPDSPSPWWAVGSHLDSVRAGGRFDGPLGVACGFEIAAVSENPVAVICFADEEGARFNTPTFGSKALVGRLDPPQLLGRHDPEGISLSEAIREAGLDPDAIAEAGGWLPALAGFIEIHIDQTTDVAVAGCPVGIVSALASRVRIEVDVRGRADHAGATPRAERRDALAAAARLIVEAEDVGTGDLRVTTSRILAEPNAPTTIASRVHLWVDARAPEAERLDDWLSAFEDGARKLAARSGVDISFEVASRSPARELSPSLRSGLLEACREVVGQPVPEVLCFAGHDAGVLAERVPAAMVLVRNPTGVSHSPEEVIDLEDGAVAARVVNRVLTSVGG